MKKYLILIALSFIMFSPVSAYANDAPGLPSKTLSVADADAMYQHNLLLKAQHNGSINIIVFLRDGTREIDTIFLNRIEVARTIVLGGIYKAVDVNAFAATVSPNILQQLQSMNIFNIEEDVPMQLQSK